MTFPNRIFDQNPRIRKICRVNVSVTQDDIQDNNCKYLQLTREVGFEL